VTCIQNFSGRTRREDVGELVLYSYNWGLRVWIAVVWLRTESSGRLYIDYQLDAPIIIYS